MKLIAITSPKGGVGKTTLALNLAFSLAKKGFRTLIVDADPQGGIGFSLKGTATAKGLAEIVAYGSEPDTVILNTKMPQLDILQVGNLAITDTAQFAQAMEQKQIFAQLRQWGSDRYDLMVIDTAPGFGPATACALANCDYMLSPVQAEPIALRSLPQLLNVVTHLRNQGHSIQIAGLILSMVDRSSEVSRKVCEEFWNNLPQHLGFHATIPRHPVFQEGSLKGLPVALLKDQASGATAVFDQIATELLSRTNMKVEDQDDEPESFFA